jgi:hypothetical protein
MFVQSEKFELEHEGRIGDIAIYGQESNYTMWRLCKMNLAVRGIDADIKWNSDGCDINELTDEVWISPTAPAWIEEVARAVCELVGHSTRFHRSSLLDQPMR